MALKLKRVTMWSHLPRLTIKYLLDV